MSVFPPFIELPVTRFRGLLRTMILTTRCDGGMVATVGVRVRTNAAPYDSFSLALGSVVGVIVLDDTSKGARAH